MKKASIKERRTALIVCVIIVCFFSIVFILESVLHFDIGSLFDPCGFKQQYHLPCITCGFTTSLRAFARGDIIESFKIQPAAALLNCIMVIYAATCLFVVITGKIPDFAVRIRQLRRMHLIIALVVILLMAWAVTLTRALVERGIW